MKRRKKLLCLIVSFVLILSMSFSAYAQNTQLMTETSNNLDSYMDIQKEAVNAVENLYSHFSQSSNGTITYPSEYAGEYIEDDQLFILLTDMSEETTNKYRVWANNYNKLSFIQAQYSLNQLNTIRDSFDSLADDYALVSYGVDRKNNNVFVNVEANDVNNLQNYIYKTRASYPIVIAESEPIVATASLYGGDGIGITSSSSNGASICIGGTYGGSNAILTCGHGFNKNQTVYKGGSSIGTVAYQSFGGWNGDFSIITLNSSYTPTNKVRSSSGYVSITGCTYYPTTGVAVYKYGNATGYAYGTINQVDVTVNIETGFSGQVTVKGLYGTSIRNSSGGTSIAEGDSGGSVYIKNGSSYNIVGNVSCKVTNQTTTYQTMYFSPIRLATGVNFSVKTN